MAGSGNMPKRVLADPRQAWDVGAFAPAGGLRATVGDLLRLAWTAVRPEESPFPAAAADALTQRVARGNGYVGRCWMIERNFHTGQQSAWHNGGTGSGMAFIGASSSFAAALCVPGRRWQAWNAIALRALAEPAD
jgi:CubicO group peptidase (beta-lactamase class C family)